MPMNSKKNWANGGTTEQTRNANERASGRTSKRITGKANGQPNDRVNGQTVRRALTGENEEMKNLVKELAKPDGQTEWTEKDFSFLH